MSDTSGKQKKTKIKSLFNPFDAVTISTPNTSTSSICLQDISFEMQQIYRKIRKSDLKTKIKGFDELEEWLYLCKEHKEFLSNLSPIFPSIYNQSSIYSDRHIREVSQKLLHNIIATKDKKWILPFISDIIFAWIGSLNDPVPSIRDLSKKSFNLCFQNPSKIAFKYGNELEIKALEVMSSSSFATINTMSISTNNTTGSFDDDAIFEEILAVTHSFSVLEFLVTLKEFKGEIPIEKIMIILSKKPTSSSIGIHVIAYRFFCSIFSDFQIEKGFFETLMRDLGCDTLSSFSLEILSSQKISAAYLLILSKMLPLIFFRRSDITVEFIESLKTFFIDKKDVALFERIILDCILNFKSYKTEKLKVLTISFINLLENNPLHPLLREYTEHLIKSNFEGFEIFKDEVILMLSEDVLEVMLSMILPFKNIRNIFLFSIPCNDKFIAMVLQVLKEMDFDELLSIMDSSSLSPWKTYIVTEYLFRQIAISHPPLDCDNFIALFQASSKFVQQELISSCNLEWLNVMSSHAIHIDHLENRNAIFNEICSQSCPSDYFFLLLRILDDNGEYPPWTSSFVPSDSFIDNLSLKDCLEKKTEWYYLNILYASYGVHYESPITHSEMAKFMLLNILDPMLVIEMLPKSPFFTELFIQSWSISIQESIIKHCSQHSPALLHNPLLINSSFFKVFKQSPTITLLSKLFLEINLDSDCSSLLGSFFHLSVFHITLLEEDENSGLKNPFSLKIKDLFFQNVLVFQSLLEDSCTQYGGMYLFLAKKLTEHDSVLDDLCLKEVSNYSFSKLFLLKATATLKGDLDDIPNITSKQLINVMIPSFVKRSLFFEIISNFDLLNIPLLPQRSLSIILAFLIRNVPYINDDFLISPAFEAVLEEVLDCSLKKGAHIWKDCLELMVKLGKSQIVTQFELQISKVIFSRTSPLSPIYDFLHYSCVGLVGIFWKSMESSLLLEVIRKTESDSLKILCCKIIKNKIDFALLKISAQKKIEKKDVGCGLVDLFMLEEYSLNNNDDYLSFLLLWDVFISLSESVEGEQRVFSLYGEYLYDCGYLQEVIVKLSILIGWIDCGLEGCDDNQLNNIDVNDTSNKNNNDSTNSSDDNLFIYFEFGRGSISIKRYATHIFYRLIKRFPSTLRRYFMMSFNHARKEYLLSKIKELFSPPLIDREIARLRRYSEVETSSTNDIESKIKIFVERSSTRCLILISYELEETKVTMRWCIKDEYPLVPLELENDGKSILKGVSGAVSGKMRNWLMLARSIIIQGIVDMNILEMILKWKNTIDLATKGESPCPICYYVLHPQDKSTPSSKCSTCKNKFHPICIYKWFKSGQNTCPMCRSIM